MAYQMAATAVTLNDLEGRSQVASFSNAIRRTLVQHSARFQLTVCSHGSSALSERLVFFLPPSVFYYMDRCFWNNLDENDVDDKHLLYCDHVIVQLMSSEWTVGRRWNLSPEIEMAARRVPSL